MVDVWLVRGVGIPLPSATLFADARQRVLASRRLSKYHPIILGDWPQGDEHWRWVCKAKVSEIESWAKEIADGQ
jgi:hypothetical protein